MKRVNAVASSLGAGIVFGMMFLITSNIIGRKLGYPLLGAIGVAGFMLAIVVFLGLSHCEEKESHIRVEFLIHHLTPKIRMVVLIFDYLVALLLFTTMTVVTGIDSAHSFQIKEMLTGAVLLPEYPVKAIVTLGCALMSIQVLLNIIRFIKQRRLESRTERVRKEFA